MQEKGYLKATTVRSNPQSTIVKSPMKVRGKYLKTILKMVVVTIGILITVHPTDAEESMWDKLTAFEDLRKQVLVLDQEERYFEAVKVAEEVVNLGTEIYGPNHPDVELALKNFASILNNLAEQYVIQGKYDKAEPHHQRALVIRGDILGIYFPDLEQSLYNLANVYRAQGRYAEAINLFKRALTIREKALGKDHPSVTLILESLAKAYKKIGKNSEATLLEEHAKQIRLSLKN